MNGDKERAERDAALAAATGTAVEFGPSDKRCCELAYKFRGACVCEYITRCGAHGEQHHGSHS